MKKKIFAILITLILCLSVVTPAFASNYYVIDNASLLRTDEIAELDIKAGNIEDTFGYSVLFCIENDANIDMYQTSVDYYNSVASSNEGIIITHNIASEEYIAYVSGNVEDIFTEDVQSNLWDTYYNNESYYGGIYDYYNAVEALLSNGETSIESSTDSKVIPEERTLPLVVDNADLLTDTEEADLEERLNTLTDTYKIEAAILTITDLEGKTPQAYADDFYDYNGYGYGNNADGLLVLYKPGEVGDRELYISTCGKAIDIFTDLEIDYLLENMKENLINEYYYDAFSFYVDECENVIVDYNKVGVDFIWIPICIIGGFILAFIITAIQVSALKSVRQKTNATEYVRTGSLAITNQQDIFLYRNITKTRIEKNNSSTTHTSSSGRSHGGGGTSF